MKYEKEKAVIKTQYDEKQETLRKKYEIEKLRQRLEDAQKKE